MDYILSSLSYDFGQQRANANVSGLENRIAFISVNVGVNPPDNISAADLNDYLVKEVRKALEEASRFSIPDLKK